MGQSKNTVLFQVLMYEKSETTHKLICDIQQSETFKSNFIRDIIKSYYKDKIPFGWEEYKKKNNL